MKQHIIPFDNFQLENKIFEGYLDSYYQEITADEYEELSEDGQEFPEKNLSYLERVLDNGRNSKINNTGDRESSCIDFRNTRDNFVSLVFTEYIGDDYYIVWIGDTNGTSRFKCDQFEGLKKLYQDRGFI